MKPETRNQKPETRFHRVERCFGLTLWAGASRHVELWCCFHAVQPHSHPGQAVEIVPLFGWGTFFRETPVHSLVQSVPISLRRWFHSFTIPSGWKHWFSLTPRTWNLTLPMLFLSITNGRSPAENFAYE